MESRSILVLASDPELADRLAVQLADGGYRVVCQHSSLGVMRLLRESTPDLLMVSLAHAPIRGNWRLIEQVYNDPTVATQVIAVVDHHTCAPEVLASLDDMTAGTLPMQVEQDVLLTTVCQVVGPVEHQPTPTHRRSHQVRLRSDRVEDATPEVTPGQIDRIMLGLGRSGLPTETLKRIELLSEHEREILGRGHFLTNEERQQILKGIKAEIDRLWALRRQDLLITDPGLRNLPSAALARSTRGGGSVTHDDSFPPGG